MNPKTLRLTKSIPLMRRKRYVRRRVFTTVTTDRVFRLRAASGRVPECARYSDRA